MRPRPLFFVLVAGAAMFLAGCSKSEPIDTTALEQAFQPPAPGNTAPTALQHSAVKQLLERGLAAIKTNNFEEAALALQRLRQNPSLNADQLTAIQELLTRLQRDLVQKAGRGDTNAEAALERLNRMPGR